jgi:hypothetical protein
LEGDGASRDKPLAGVLLSLSGVGLEERSLSLLSALSLARSVMLIIGRLVVLGGSGIRLEEWREGLKVVGLVHAGRNGRCIC